MRVQQLIDPHEDVCECPVIVPQFKVRLVQKLLW
jgi:hypothetical protein